MLTKEEEDDFLPLNRSTSRAQGASRMGNNASRMGNNASRMGNNASRMGNNASRMGKPVSRAQGASRMGNNASRAQGASRMGNNASRMGKNASRMGNNPSRLGGLGGFQKSKLSNNRGGGRLGAPSRLRAGTSMRSQSKMSQSRLGELPLWVVVFIIIASYEIYIVAPSS